MSEARLSWVNGCVADSVAVSERGLAYGDGVFETVRVTATGPVLKTQHWQRLVRGLDRLGIVGAEAALRCEWDTFPGWAQAGVVKVIVTRGCGGRGYQEPAQPQPTRILMVQDAPQYPSSYAAVGVAVHPCRSPLAIAPHLAGIKHLNRLEQVLARAEWRGCDFAEGLMADTEGSLVEGVSSNFFLVHAGHVVTPLLDRCGIAGVMRQWIIEQLEQWQVPVTQQRVSRADIEAADEWFFCNSVRGVWPVKFFGRQSWQPGPLTRRLQVALEQEFGLI